MNQRCGECQDWLEDWHAQVAPKRSYAEKNAKREERLATMQMASPLSRSIGLTAEDISNITNSLVGPVPVTDSNHELAMILSAVSLSQVRATPHRSSQ